MYRLKLSLRESYTLKKIPAICLLKLFANWLKYNFVYSTNVAAKCESNHIYVEVDNWPFSAMKNINRRK